MHLCGLMHVVENPYHPQNRGGINALAERLVVKAHVAARDGNLQLLASLGYAINGLGELPHDMWLLRIAEVEAISRAHRSCARPRHLARSFSDGVHRPKTRIEIPPPAVAIQSHREATLRDIL